MLEVPATTHAITAHWLTLALRESGLLKTEVSRLTLEPIAAGVGLMGELGRLHVEYAGDEALPATIIAKCAAQNENREIARLLDFYNREVNFYNRLSDSCPLNIPISYYGAVRSDTYDFVLLMEDLGEVFPHDQLVGATREEVFGAITNIAGLHAIHWNKMDVGFDWVFAMASDFEAGRLQDLVYGPALEPAIEKFPKFFDTEMIELCRNVGRKFVSFWTGSSCPDTFVHGDYRQDNMIYGDDMDNTLVIDWQISGRGKGIFDVTYFMCQSVSSELRAELEVEVLKHYVSELSNAGIEYSFDDCWLDYRRLILACLVYPITVCGSLDTANERGRALGESMLSRNFAAIKELGCASLL